MQIVNKMKYVLTTLMCFVILDSFSQVKKNDTLYVFFNKKNKLLKLETNRNSKISSFKILKKEFNTKKKRDIYNKKTRTSFEIASTFYITFVVIGQPKKVFYLNESFHSIKDISSAHIFSRENTFFVEQIKPNVFLVYKTMAYMQE